MPRPKKPGPVTPDLDPNSKPKPLPLPEPREPTPEEVAAYSRFCGQSVMQEALYGIGLTPELAAKALLTELNATTQKVQMVEGSFRYSKPVIAWDVRQKARQDLTRYWGAYKETERDDSPLVVEIRDCSAADPKPDSDGIG